MRRRLCRCGFYFLSLFFFLQGTELPSEINISTKQGPTVVLPTFARNVSATVERGGKASIVLNAIPSFGSQIFFEITSSPKHGSLSGVTCISDHSAVVSYWHDGSKNSPRDRFTFRCKAPGHAKSSPAFVDIQITPPPACLHSEPGFLDFGSVMLGGKVRRSITLSNTGGTKAVGRIILPGSFSAPDGDAYSLEEGESILMPIEFSPMEARNYRSSATFLPARENAALELSGCGLQRFEISRLADTEWEVTNISSDPIRISCQRAGGEEAWILPPARQLAPSSRMRLSFSQDERANGMEGGSQPEVIRISDGLSTREVQLPTPARFTPLTVRSLSVSSARSIPLGTSLRVSFILINGSEVSKRARWRAHSALGGRMELSEVVEMKPGETKEIPLTWSPSLPGEGWLGIFVEEGNNKSQEIGWHVSVAPQTTPTLPLVFPVMKTSSETSSSALSLETTSSTSSPGTSIPEPSSLPTTTPPMDSVSWGIRDPWYGKPTAYLQWTSRKEIPQRIRVEEKRLIMPKAWDFKDLSATPSECPKIEATNIPLRFHWERGRGDCHTVLLPDLDPGCHGIVLSRASDDGMPGATSEVQIVVPGPKSWWSSWGVPLVAVLLFFLIFFQWRRTRL